MNALLVLLIAASLGPYDATAAGVGTLEDINNELSISEPLSHPDAMMRRYVNIAHGPRTATHVAGDETVLTCEARGHPAPSIQWLRNDVPIRQDEGESNDLIVESDSTVAVVLGTLRILTVSPRPADQYTCEARAGASVDRASATVFNDHSTIPSQFKSLASLNRHLLSSHRAPVITTYARYYMGNEGATLVLPCRATGHPRPEVYWRKQGEEIHGVSDGRVKVLDNGDLAFIRARWVDMGQYVCTMRNDYGEQSVESFLYPVANDDNKMQQLRREKDLNKN